jgi:hypothetical protein
MNTRFIKSFVVVIIFFLVSGYSVTNAQYVDRGNYIGPCIGFSFLGSVPQFGANYEYGLNVPNFGLLGIGGVFRYWGYSDSYFGGKWSYTNILIGAQGNYHFIIPGNSKLDPYAGLVLAYDGGSVSWSGPNYNYSSPSYGGFWIALQGGLRYWVSPTIAITGRLAFGSLSYGGLEVGADFKF